MNRINISSEALVKKYLEGNKKAFKILLDRFSNVTENITEKCYMDDLLQDGEYEKITKSAMLKAAQTYNREKGACFYTYFSTVFRNALIDKRRKILCKKAESKKITTWKEFKKIKKEKGNIFSIRNARYLLFNILWEEFYYDDEEIKTIIGSFTKRELQYISLCANADVTNLIAAKALKVVPRTIYNLKRSIADKLEMKDFESIFKNKEEFY
jgi:DNA-binding CsgD family transcriptional regulator